MRVLPRRRERRRLNEVRREVGRLSDIAALRRTPDPALALDELLVAERSLRDLDRRLREATPADGQLVERVADMLEDPQGPLRAPRRPGALRDAIREIIGAPPR